MDSREDLGLVCKNPDRAHFFFFLAEFGQAGAVPFNNKSDSFVLVLIINYYTLEFYGRKRNIGVSHCVEQGFSRFICVLDI